MLLVLLLLLSSAAALPLCCRYVGCTGTNFCIRGQCLAQVSGRSRQQQQQQQRDQLC
jgi:hypothetical protein